ncbi:hypothetical protein KEM55_006176, partial [Ascosphaera atra]
HYTTYLQVRSAAVLCLTNARVTRGDVMATMHGPAFASTSHRQDDQATATYHAPAGKRSSFSSPSIRGYREDNQECEHGDL